MVEGAEWAYRVSGGASWRDMAESPTGPALCVAVQGVGPLNTP